MRPSVLVTLAACACACAPAPRSSEVTALPPEAQAQDSPEAEPITHACEPGGEAHERATRDLEAIADGIARLAPTDDPGPQWTTLTELFAGECFALRDYLPMYGDDELPTSGLALRTWWEDGGDVWAGQFLTLDTTWERPSMREAFAPELVPDHPLADLFCPIDDLDCDPRTFGWLQRAKHAFEDHAEIRWTRFRADDEDLPPVRDWSHCEGLALSKPELLRYETWAACIDHVTLRQSVFPIGGLRAPAQGWFVIRGRRGHYQFCDEIRIFDLATGSVHAVGSCAGLVLREGGAVDGDQTDAGRELRRVSGRVPVDALREAVWMTLWSSEMNRYDRVLGGVGYPIPEGIEPMVQGRLGLMGVSMSSGQTTLDWSYVRDDHEAVDGHLRWPEDYNNAAVDHAVRLLQIAEAAMVEGCAPAGVPKFPLTGDGTGVWGIDADRGALRETQRELEQALAEIKAPRCRGS